MNILRSLKRLALLAILLSIPTMVLAQGNLSNAGSRLRNVGQLVGVNTESDLPTVAGQVISTALTLVGIIFLILMVYAGYLWMTARGDEGQVEHALGIVKTCVIGLVVVMSAYAITFFVLGRFGDRATNSESEILCCMYHDNATNRDVGRSVPSTSACEAICTDGALPPQFSNCSASPVPSVDYCG